MCLSDGGTFLFTSTEDPCVLQVGTCGDYRLMPKMNSITGWRTVCVKGQCLARLVNSPMLGTPVSLQSIVASPQMIPRESSLMH